MDKQYMKGVQNGKSYLMMEIQWPLPEETISTTIQREKRMSLLFRDNRLRRILGLSHDQTYPVIQETFIVFLQCH